MRSVHNRLREALKVTREAARAGVPAEPAARELLLFCRGFCTALTGHHVGEDSRLFPAIAAAHPELRENAALSGAGPFHDRSPDRRTGGGDHR